MRFNSFDFPTPNNAAACAAYETEKAVRTEIFNRDVEFQIGLEKMKVATAPEKWIYNHTADPSMELAILYKQIALYWNDEAEIGRIVKTVVENRLRTVAEFVVGDQE